MSLTLTGSLTTAPPPQAPTNRLPRCPTPDSARSVRLTRRRDAPLSPAQLPAAKDVQEWRWALLLSDTRRVRLHHRWDDEDRPRPDLTDPATAAALTKATRDVRIVKLIHLALLAVGIGLLALALLLRAD
jgi:hypothetical protein